MARKSIRLVVVEDQMLFQQLLTAIAAHRFGYTVVGVAADGMEAMRVCRETRPDLVLLDLLIPKISGLVVAENLRSDFPDIRILAVSSENDPYTIHRAFRIGLDGFLDKGSQTLDSLAEAIQVVADGGVYFSPRILRIRDEQGREPLAFQKILTPREQEVLALAGGCFSDQEIGELLGLSPSTIQTHRKNIMGKVGVHSTPELIRYALDQGFWKPHENRINQEI